VDLATHFVDRSQPMGWWREIENRCGGIWIFKWFPLRNSRRCHFSRQAQFQKVSEFPTLFFLYLGWVVKVTLIEKTTDRVHHGDDRVVLLIPVISPLNVVPSKVHILMIEQFQRNDHWMDVGNLPDLFSFFIFFFSLFSCSDKVSHSHYASLYRWFPSWNMGASFTPVDSRAYYTRTVFGIVAY
jgi:hypothetical protein